MSLADNSCPVMPDAVLCCAVLCCAVLCCAVPCPCCAVLCCAVLCCAVLCCAVLCCAVLCCAVLCLCVLSDGCCSVWVRVPGELRFKLGCVAPLLHPPLRASGTQVGGGTRDTDTCAPPWGAISFTLASISSLILYPPFPYPLPDLLTPPPPPPPPPRCKCISCEVGTRGSRAP